MSIEASEILVQFRVDSSKADQVLKVVSGKLKELGLNAESASLAMGEVDKSFKMAAGDTTQIITGINNINTNIERQISLTEQLVGSLRKQKNALKEVAKGQDVYNGVAKNVDNTMERIAAQSNRFNSANILAQFQDIAVTAQMGMNPLMIAVQQGTQLQYILAQSKAPLKDLAAGFKMLINPISLCAIGITGLIASLIQWINWVSVGKTSLNALASAFDFVAENIKKFSVFLVAAGSTMAILNAGAIATLITGFIKLGIAGVGAATSIIASWLVVSAPLLAVPAAVGLIAVAFVNAADESGEAWDNFKKSFYQALNDMVGAVVSFGYKVSGIFDILANAPFKGWDEAVKDYGKEVNRLWHETDYLDLMDAATGRATSNTVKHIKEEYGGVFDDFTKSIEDKLGGSLSKIGKTIMGTIEGGIEKAATSASKSLKNVAAHLGEDTKAAKKLEKELEKLKKAWESITTSGREKIEDLQVKRASLGQTTFQKTYEKELKDMIQKAQEKNIDLYKIDETGQTKIAQLEEIAKGIANETELLEKETEAFNFAKSSVKGFFSDMRQGLKEGESAWEAFGNAVSNVLDKILDKIMDIGVDALFNAGYGYGKSAGWWGSGTQVYSSPIGPTQTGTPLSSVSLHAQGGVFTNGVYSSPTMFKFAKGGKFGVMGESGPEAVMPLTRNSDGTLGVKATNVGNSSPVVVNVINNSTAQARVEQRETSNGTEIDVMIDQLVAEKMGKPGTSSNTALRAFNNQKLIAR